MGDVQKDALTDVVHNLPAAAQRPADKPAGTVVNSSGERITLGEEPTKNSGISSTRKGMNIRNMQF